jgi:hypothetical protein
MDFPLVYAQSAVLVSKSAADSINTFILRNIPVGSKTAHPILIGKFGPGPGNIVALLGDNYYYGGEIYVPNHINPEIYQKFELPSIDEISLSTVAVHNYEVRAVFFDNVDADPENELLILFHNEGWSPVWDNVNIGNGGRTWGEENVTAIYDWTGHSFVYLFAKSDALWNIKTAVQIKKKIKKLQKTGW